MKFILTGLVVVLSWLIEPARVTINGDDVKQPAVTVRTNPTETCTVTGISTCTTANGDTVFNGGAYARLSVGSKLGVPTK